MPINGVALAAMARELFPMSFTTVEVEIDHGQLVAREPHLLPENGLGLLTILRESSAVLNEAARKRVELPLVRGATGTVIEPTPEDLDASLWD